MKKVFFIVVIFVIICVYFAGCTVNVSPTASSSSMDAKSLRQLYESGLPVPENQPFFDKDHNCLVFHDGKKATCGTSEQLMARNAEA